MDCLHVGTAPIGRTWGVRRTRVLGADAELLIGAPDADGLLAWAVDELSALERSWAVPGAVPPSGRIGTGHAADLVVEGLLARGAASVSLSIGGDVRVGGIPPVGAAWTVDVVHPFDAAGTAFTLRIGAGAVASGAVHRRPVVRPSSPWVRRGAVGSTAPAWSDVAAAVVVAPDAWRAQWLVDVFLERGGAAGRALLGRCSATAWTWESPRSAAVRHAA